MEKNKYMYIFHQKGVSLSLMTKAMYEMYRHFSRPWLLTLFMQFCVYSLKSNERFLSGCLGINPVIKARLPTIMFMFNYKMLAGSVSMVAFEQMGQ